MTVSICLDIEQSCKIIKRSAVYNGYGFLKFEGLSREFKECQLLNKSFYVKINNIISRLII